MVEQSNYCMRDNGVKGVAFRSREELSKHCKLGFDTFIEWSEIKSEAFLKGDKVGCQVAQISGEVLLKEKYNKASFIKEVCALPVLACTGTSYKEEKTDEEIRACVLKHSK